MGTTVGAPVDYGADRQFVHVKVDDDPTNEETDVKMAALREAGYPQVTLMLKDKYALAGEFFRWEYATAVAGKLLGINPFDEPNVTESKQNTARLLDYWREHNHLPEREPVLTQEDVSVYVGEKTLAPLRELGASQNYDLANIVELLAAQIAGTNTGDYFALLAYLP